MMGALHEIISILTGKAKPLPVVCSLPPRPAPKEKGKAPKKEPGVYVIDEERAVFGFRDDREADRKGAVQWLTNFDKEVLQSRSLFGAQKNVQEQNATCKKCWAMGDTVSECEMKMKVGSSWIEKRYACFSTALAQEGERG